MRKKKGKASTKLAAVIAIVIAVGAYSALRGEKELVESPRLSLGSEERLNLGDLGARRHEDPSGFSFEIPQGYETRAISGELDKAIVVERQGEPGRGFQIAVSYYDEPASRFTIARIRKDLPDLVMRDAKEFEIADGRGVMFDSDTGREIWFVAGESLYQISSPLSDADAAEHAAATFEAE